MKLKVCGLKNQCNIADLSKEELDYMGFIFYDKSPRVVELSENLIEEINLLKTKKVGVFVNSKIDLIKSLCSKLNLDYVQLHGNESPQFVKEVQKFVKIIKVFKIESKEDLNETKSYDFADLFLFDTKGKYAGGNGEKFNWEILKSYDGQVPFLLSGGIHLKDINNLELINHSLLVGVDINSGFELDYGLKNIDLVREFREKLNKIKKYV